MRILHVLGERGFSGGENQLLATVRFLQAREHDQVFVLDPRAQFKQNLDELGLPYHEVRYRNNYDPIAARQIRKQYRALAPDLIHLADSRSHKVGAIASMFGGSLPPRVVTRRMDYPIGNTPFRRWIYGKAVNAVVAISTGVRDAILKVGVDPSRIELIHEGVDTARFGAVRTPERRAAARARFALTDADFFGVTTASLHVRKAHDILLEALGRLTIPAGRRVVWLFGGEGPEKGKLRALAQQLPENIEVRIPGQIDYVEDALAAADAYCLPSRYEGLGVALLEAISTGVPCIASKVGGMRDVLVDGESGLHVPPGEVDGLVPALQRLLDDPALAARLGAAGKARAAEMFDIERMGRATEALYQRLVDTTGPGRSGI